MDIILVIIMGLIVSGIIVTTKRVSGDETGFSKEDERQKKILKDAAMSSWQVIMLYALIRLANLLPFLNGFADPTTLQSIAFFSNGGDILLIAAIGYGMGAVTSYFRYS
ncbi:hypothetical protein GLW07_13220 [Bacillus hwajinpoensis]|uniref:DUF3784 domain-containing protein n=1 Tax=Guptibacillus hwajinpoensis TaxID=208199 RepID=A0A845F046_9BACL|nr:hypothetical protein [Pseudalkalibacillus hwajinpoensis]MYL64312.1 hypothetical protein [Pseudalkalibacillus hwajinpoensis]